MLTSPSKGVMLTSLSKGVMLTSLSKDAMLASPVPVTASHRRHQHK
jgi:hypothetical protein